MFRTGEVGNLFTFTANPYLRPGDYVKLCRDYGSDSNPYSVVYRDNYNFMWNNDRDRIQLYKPSDSGSDAHSYALPALPGQPDPASESGRGLLIVDTLAAQWGTEPRSPRQDRLDGTSSGAPDSVPVLTGCAQCTGQQDSGIGTDCLVAAADTPAALLQVPCPDGCCNALATPSPLFWDSGV
jgi:hypothetical protein